ncbi:MAG: HNH endonuclease [Dehalococcoidia bacterium]
MVKRPRPHVKLTRHRVFSRDNYTCQYCGKQSNDLTLDHVVPRYRGGEHSWHNVVSACKNCNQRKAGRTPAEAGMKLMRKPCEPSGGTSHLIYPFNTPPEWQSYLSFNKLTGR